MAPDVLVDWVGLVEGVDNDITGLEVATTVARDGVALPVVLLTALVDKLEFDAMDDGIETEEAKGGAGTTSEGLTSAPVPQGISEPSGSTEFAGGVV